VLKTLKNGDFKAFLLHQFTQQKSRQKPAFLVNF
jgi:hypothetical protein